MDAATTKKIIFFAVLLGLAFVNTLGWEWAVLVSICLVAIAFITVKDIGETSLYGDAKNANR